MLKIRLKVGLNRFFKNLQGIFDFGFDTKAQSAANSDLGVKKSVERWHRNAKTMKAIENLIPDSKRG